MVFLVLTANTDFNQNQVWKRNSNNLVPRDFSLAPVPPPSQGKVPGNDVGNSERDNNYKRSR